MSQPRRAKRCVATDTRKRTTTNDSIAFHPAPASLAAQNFSMPALSPTMTEGNIATWKIKEGTTDPLSYRAPAPRTTKMGDMTEGLSIHWKAFD